MFWVVAAVASLTLTVGQADQSEATCPDATPAGAWEEGRTVEAISYGMLHFAGPWDAHCYPTQGCRGPADLTGSNCEPMALHELTILFRDHPARFHETDQVTIGPVTVALPEGVKWIVECVPFGWHDYRRRQADPRNGSNECLLAPVHQLAAFGAAVEDGAEAAGYRRVTGQNTAVPRTVYWHGCHAFGWYADRAASMGLVMPLEGEGEAEFAEIENRELELFVFERPITPPSGYPVDAETGEPINAGSGRPISEDPWTAGQCAEWAQEGVGWYY